MRVPLKRYREDPSEVIQALVEAKPLVVEGIEGEPRILVGMEGLKPELHDIDPLDGIDIKEYSQRKRNKSAWLE